MSFVRPWERTQDSKRSTKQRYVCLKAFWWKLSDAFMALKVHCNRGCVSGVPWILKLFWSKPDPLDDYHIWDQLSSVGARMCKKELCELQRGSTRMFSAEAAFLQGCCSPRSELRKGWACGRGLQPTPAVLSVPVGPRYIFIILILCFFYDRKHIAIIAP